MLGLSSGDRGRGCESRSAHVAVALGSFLIVGVEGLICIVMTLPLAVPLGALGSWLVYRAETSRSATRGGIAMLLLLPPASLTWDVKARPPVFEVRSAITIAAFAGTSLEIRGHLPGVARAARCSFALGPGEETEMKNVYLFCRPAASSGTRGRDRMSCAATCRPCFASGHAVVQGGSRIVEVAERTAMKIVIPGGSGQVGHILARHFHSQGHAVTVFSRRPRPAPWRVVSWDGLTPGDWIADLEQSDVCINLAGRSVNCRYTAANRRAIFESRIRSTRLLNEVIASVKRAPRLWINASTATIYRHALDRAMNETDGELGGNEPGAPDTWKFSIDVAKAWEEAFFSTRTPRTRKIAIRSAMTFSPDRGGVFDVFLGLVRRGLGGRQGPGTQFVSWIHEADFVRAVDLLIAREAFDGVVNLASPNPIPNEDFMRVLREAWGVRIGLPSPAWMFEMGTWLMRTESELVLKSRRVVPGRLLDAGFQFLFPAWPAAARDLVERWRKVN